MEDTAVLNRRKEREMKAVGIIIFLVMATLATGCAITHRYDPYFGKVVDKETMEPIEGAVVVAVYFTERANLAGAISHYADAQETVTDKNGEFRIPAIRINTLRPLSVWAVFNQIKIFKPGYGCYPDHKDVEPVFANGSLPFNTYVTVKLPMLKTRKERLMNYECFPHSAPDKAIKQLLKAINVERANLGLEPLKEAE
jgi:hypothetical protein